jgi:hypothetical protein
LECQVLVRCAGTESDHAELPVLTWFQ